MVEKRVAICGNCHCRLAVTFERMALFPAMYCTACEPLVTHREEIKESNGRQYRAALRA